MSDHRISTRPALQSPVTAGPVAGRPRWEAGAWPVLVTPGPITPEAGLETVVRALPLILTRLPRARWVVVGRLPGGPEGGRASVYLDFVKGLAGLLGVERALRLVIDGQDVQEDDGWVSAGDIRVFPCEGLSAMSVAVLARALTDCRPAVVTSFVSIRTPSRLRPARVVPTAYPLAVAEAVVGLAEERRRDERVALSMNCPPRPDRLPARAVGVAWGVGPNDRS